MQDSFKARSGPSTAPDFPFAIAAKSFDHPSVTFIRLHATELFPGKTALLSQEDTSPSFMDAPCLTAFNKVPGPPFGAIRRQKRISEFLRAQGVKVVMAEYGPIGLDVIAGAQRANCAVFVHFHGYDASRLLRKPRVVRAYRGLFPKLRGLFVPSGFLGQRLIDIGCPRELISVSPCGVDPSRFQRTTGDPNKALAVGRFVAKKAPLHTLTAFAAVAAGRSNLTLDFVGDGPLLPAAQQFVEEKRLGNQVRFHGAQPHSVVQELMKTAGVFLQHSVEDESGDCEGMPVAILEAMCAGLAVVATKHSGIPEAVEDGKSGLLVPEHDAQAMADALCRVIEEGGLRESLGAEAYERVQHKFTAEHTLDIIRQRVSAVIA